MSSIKLTHLHRPLPVQIGETLYQFLNYLSGPTVIHIKGQDSSRCRVVVTLLHGNEPSGLKAIHQLLLSQFTPCVDTKFIVASVVAARTEPVFEYRMLPGQHDLNRCFGNSQRDLQSLLASAIKSEIETFQAEAIIDLHNTSGSGPAFSVSTSNSEQHIAMAAHFTHRMIFTDLRLGSIMEQQLACPIITVEAGGAHDNAADLTALEGIKSFLSAPNVFERIQEVELLYNPRRLELKTTGSIAYAQAPIKGTSLTMRQDIERLNFGTTKANQLLGWLFDNTLDTLQLDSSDFNVGDYFMVHGTQQDGFQLKTKCPLTLFMVTTRADIASSDCLFYFVKA
ncbi:MAG: putative deacylase [Alphaproteobacteria bacterium]|jgi:predicted deacylase